MPPEFLDREWRWGQRLGRWLWTAGGLVLGGPKRRWAALVGGTILIGGSVLWLQWGLAGLLSSLLAITFGVPAPGEPLDLATWTTPQNGLWADVMILSRVAVGIAVVGWLLLTVRVAIISDIAVRRAELKRVGKTVLLVGTTWTIVPFTLHLTNELARALAPSPEQLLDALAGTTAGLAVLGAVAWFQPFFVAVGVLSTLILQALIIIGFVVWPIAWVLRSIESPLAGMVGRSATAVFVVSVATKLLQAIGAALVVWLVVTIESGPFRIAVFVAGVVGVFVALPIVMLRHAEALMRLPVAIAPIERQVGRYVDESAARVGQVQKTLVDGHQRVHDWRTGPDVNEIFETRSAPSGVSGGSDDGWFGGFSSDVGTGWFERSSNSDSDAGWFERSSNNDADAGWLDRFRGSASGTGWLGDWISREFPEGSYTESRQQMGADMADGEPGPTSEGPGDETMNNPSERERGRWGDSDN